MYIDYLEVQLSDRNLHRVFFKKLYHRISLFIALLAKNQAAAMAMKANVKLDWVTYGAIEQEAASLNILWFMSPKVLEALINLRSYLKF